MEVGQLGKRIGAVIQARMKSERLPGKILMPLPVGSGKPLLQHSIEGARRSKYIDEVILATSVNPENLILETFTREFNIRCFRGDEDDVLSRFVAIQQQFNFDVVIRLTGDNPVVDAAVLDDVISRHVARGNDYTKTTGLPLGMNFEIISANALNQMASAGDLDAADREHVTLYLRRHDFFQKEEIFLHYSDLPENIRLTVDYPADYALLNVVFGLMKESDFPGIPFLQKISLKFPWIFDINASAIQKQQFRNEEQELRAAVDVLKKFDFQAAAAVLEKNIPSGAK